jgi:hypothetical protein
MILGLQRLSRKTACVIPFHTTFTKSFERQIRRLIESTRRRKWVRYKTVGLETYYPFSLYIMITYVPAKEKLLSINYVKII